MNKASQERYALMAEHGCLIAHYWPEEAKNCGGKLENNHLNSIAHRKRDDMRTVRLCFNHHQAQSPLPVGEAYHKGSKLFRAKYGDDEALLAKENERLWAV